ncbi:MAG: hypothetical protein ACPL1G_09645 [Thermodesulfovibrionales bacterium]
MRKIAFVIFVSAIFFITSFSYAQFGKSVGPRFYSEFKPIVGGWSEYQITVKGEPPSKMKIAIVGKEGDAYWYETVMETKLEGKVITKILVSGNPEDQKNIKRMIVKMGNEPAKEVPVRMMGQPQKTQGESGKVLDKGEETIKVPAGTFKTRHMQYQEPEGIMDSWVYKDVSPYGLIKSQTKEIEMVLIGYGTGAKTLITETPQKFEMPQIP